MSNQAPKNYESEGVEAYLNRLRKSGVTNMYGATPYLQKKFRVDKHLATEWLVYWMENFGKGEPK